MGSHCSHRFDGADVGVTLCRTSRWNGAHRPPSRVAKSMEDHCDHLGAILGDRGPRGFPRASGTITGLFQNVEGDPSVEGRTQDYPHVVRLFLENPVFGKGQYTWATYYYRTLDNQALVTLLELGAFGFLAFVGLILTGALSGIGCRLMARGQRQRHLGLCLGASVLGISLSFVTFDALGFSQTAGMTFLLIGMTGAAWRLSRESRDIEISEAEDV